MTFRLLTKRVMQEVERREWQRQVAHFVLL